MKKRELRKALEDLEINQVRFAELLDKDARTARKWISGALPVPLLAAIVARGLLSGKFTIDDVREWKC